MITARLVGDDTVLAWLHTVPDATASGLANAITKLGIDLQRRVQDIDVTDQILAARSSSATSNVNIQIDEDGSRLAATVSTGSRRYARVRGRRFPGTVNVRESLRRMKKQFGRPFSERPNNLWPESRRMEFPESSFLRSALENMDPEIRGYVEQALREALQR